MKLRIFVTQISQCFEIVNLFQMFHSASFMCISIFLSTTSAPEEDNTKTVFFAFAAAGEVVLYCFAGEYLTNKFEELYHKMTQLNWYQFTKEEKRNYLIMLQNIQQPVIIQTYCSVLSRATFFYVRI